MLIACGGWGAVSTPNQADEIVRRSVANTTSDWNAASRYDFTERDLITKNGKRTAKTYEVIMIEGSPYEKLIAVNGRRLSPAQAANEGQKLRQEITRRRGESPEERRKRVEEYEKERRQDHALLSEMVKAFDYRLVGQQTVNGRRCFVLAATPKPGYQAPSRETEVLKGMRGKMWIDVRKYQWVKVHAEVFRPVNFGLFFATVKPGTEFTLEQMPVQGNLWLPSHFSMQVDARELLWSRRSSDVETYSDYHRSQQTQPNAATSHK